MRYHKEFESVFKWYLKHRIANGVKTPIPSSNLENEVWNYFWEQEQEVAWPNLLDANIVNFSKNGGHFVGHHHRLRKYLANNPKPDHIILTDYTFSHIFTSFKFEGQRYMFERENYVASEWNSDAYPIEVHNKRLASIAYQKSQPREWRQRRHYLGYKNLIKFMEQQGLTWSIVRFGDVADDNIKAFDFMGREIDCISLYQEYSTPEGENSEFKLRNQIAIAAVVGNKLSIAVRS
jgi:hypothetical protein